MSPRWRRSACVALLAISGCYETRTARIRVRVPTTQLNCAETTDRVFGEAGFARVGAVQGPGFFYSPRSNTVLGLHWGIGVWLESSNDYRDQSRCDFELQALSVDEGCGIQCELTPQPGPDYDRAVQDLARRLDAAFGGKRPSE